MPINHLQAQRFGRLELLAKQSVEGFITGLHKSPYHGFSVEFAEHRAYNTGESTRHIDWKLFGRTDKMFVKRYEEETNLRCQLIIDQSGSMHFPAPSENQQSKLQFSLQSAAALTYLMRSQRDAVGMTLFGDSVNLHLPPKSSVSHQANIFFEMDKCYDSEPINNQSNIVDTLHRAAEQSSKRSLIVVFSDFMDNAFSSLENQQKLYDALQHLRYNKHEVVLFHVFDKKTEVELDLDNKPHTFIDLESGEKVKVLPSDVKSHYHELRAERINEIKLTCAKYGVDWNGCDVSVGTNKVLEQFLAKRGRLG